MKLVVAILDRDRNYLERMGASVQSKYNEKLTLISFTDETLLRTYLQEAIIDILLCSESISVDSNLITGNYTFVYLTEEPNIDLLDGYKAICKYQQISEFYRKLLNIHAECSQSSIKHKKYSNHTRIVMFLGVGGGVGASTLAAAFAYRQAATKNRVLYLTLEDFGTTSPYFQSEKANSLSEIIFSIKSKHGNAAMKLAGSVIKDSDVYFLSECHSPLDIDEVTDNEWQEVLDILKNSGRYDVIVISQDFVLQKLLTPMLHSVTNIVLVMGAASETGHRLNCFLKTMSAIARQHGVPVMEKFRLLYNKWCDGDYEIVLDKDSKNIPLLGKVPVYSKIDSKQLAKNIAQSSKFLDNLFERLV